MRIEKQKKSHKKFILGLIAILLIACIGYVVYAKIGHTWPFAETTPSTQTVDTDSEDSNENATPQHQAGASNDGTDSAANNEGAAHSEKPPVTDDTGKKKVEVAITTFNNMDPDSFTANGYVDGVIENDGTCTLTLTDSNGAKVSSSRSGHVNAKNTTCGQSSIPMSKLHSGTWSATLSYSSPTAVGTSDPVTGIEIK